MNDPLVFVRAVHFAATIAAAGAVYFRVFVAEPAFAAARGDVSDLAETVRRQSRRLVWPGLALAVLSGVVWLVLLAADLYEAPLGELWSDGGIWTVATETRFGEISLARLALAVLLTAATAGWRTTMPARSGVVSVMLATAFLVMPAWTGHAGATPGLAGALPLAADGLHLVAAGLWLGALPPLAMLLAAGRGGETANARDVVIAAVQRFSLLGMASVAVLLASGIVNSWYEVGTLENLVATDYGRLTLAKLALFAAMVSVAAVNRFYATPRLVAHDARRLLQRNCWIETALGLAAVVVVGLLGAMEPASHAHQHGANHPAYQQIAADAAFVHIHSNDGMADVTITPGRVGTARATIYLWNEDFAALDAQRLTLALAPPGAGSTSITRAAVRNPDGGWSIDGIALTAPGDWTVIVDAVLAPGRRLVIAAPIVIEPAR